MDERIEKAFETANYMKTLANQRRLLQEEFNQSLIYYTNGATFKITPELITLAKVWLEDNDTKQRVFIDANNFPVLIEDVKQFFADITTQYHESLNNYMDTFAKLKSQRRVVSMVDL